MERISDEHTGDEIGTSTEWDPADLLDQAEPAVTDAMYADEEAAADEADPEQEDAGAPDLDEQ